MVMSLSNCDAIASTWRNHDNSALRPITSDGNLFKDCLLRRERWRSGQDIPFGKHRRSIDHGNAGDFDHAVGIVEPFDFDQSDRRKVFAKYLTIRRAERLFV